MLIYFVIIHILGFKKGKNLNKVGYKAHDTAELFFEDVRLPASSVLGGLNKGFYHLMTELPQVRNLKTIFHSFLKITILFGDSVPCIASVSNYHIH